MNTGNVARVTEAIDDAIVTLLSKLAAADAIKDTVIILRGDHGLQVC